MNPIIAFLAIVGAFAVAENLIEAIKKQTKNGYFKRRDKLEQGEL